MCKEEHEERRAENSKKKKEESKYEKKMNVVVNAFGNLTCFSVCFFLRECYFVLFCFAIGPFPLFLLLMGSVSQRSSE
jgi:hypothetical protein